MVAPAPGWTFGQPRRPGAAYLARRVAWKVAGQRQSLHRVVAPWLCGTTAELVLTLPDGGSTNLTTPLMLERFGIGKDTGARIWKTDNLKPWMVETFKVSTDPNFEEKLVDVVGLYLHPPERATVFSLNENSQVQASIAPGRPCP